MRITKIPGGYVFSPDTGSALEWILNRGNEFTAEDLAWFRKPAGDQS